MITPTQVIDQLLGAAERGDLKQWWEHAAVAAIHRGHFLIIPGRQDTDAYLARYWLTPPKKDEDGYSSSESVILHQFLRGDDDGALHNHPYDFTTTILTGGYDEVMGDLVGEGPDATGPLEKNWLHALRRANDQVHKKSHELHMATSPYPNTWTMVQTGKRCNNWGFYPPGKTFVPWRQFVQHNTVVGGQQ